LKSLRRTGLAFGIGLAAASLLALRGQEAGRTVAVTIDDLPVTAVSASTNWESVTNRLLAALREHGAPAIGFVNERKLYVDGARDSSRVALLEAWLRAGQELGNHTFTHRSAHTTPLDAYLDGITKGEAITRELSQRAGRPFRYFRHPQLHAGRSLEYRRAVEHFLRAHGYTIAPVTVDNQEWVYARAYVVARERGDTLLVRRVVADYMRHLDRAFAYSEQLSRVLFDRDIPLVLLLHANEINAAYLGTILERLEARGYRFVSLEQALADTAYRSVDTYVGPVGPSWLIRWATTRGINVPDEPREEEYIAELARAPRAP